jgi:uncharacterized protein
MAEAAGTILRRARTSAQMSQTDVGRRAGVAQSVISAYESGQREPALTTLAKLVAATGHDLIVDLATSPSPQRGLPNTPMGRRLRKNRRRVIDTAARFGASNIRIFGSVARGQDTSESDIDFLIDAGPDMGLFALGRLERELAEIFHRSVDVVPADGLKPRVREAALREAILL